MPLQLAFLLGALFYLYISGLAFVPPISFALVLPALIASFFVPIPLTVFALLSACGFLVLRFRDLGGGIVEIVGVLPPLGALFLSMITIFLTRSFGARHPVLAWFGFGLGVLLINIGIFFWEAGPADPFLRSFAQSLNALVFPMGFYFVWPRFTSEPPAWLSTALLSPLWNIQLFSVIPLSLGPLHLTESRVSAREARRLLWIQGLKFYLFAQLWHLAALVLSAPFFETPSPLPWLESLAPKLTQFPAMMTWDHLREAGGTGMVWLYIFMFISLKVHLIGALTTAAIGIAWMLGFRIPLFVDLREGFRISTNWNLLMFYLNQVVLQLFLVPFLRAFAFVKSRVWRRALASFFAVTVFGEVFLLLNLVLAASMTWERLWGILRDRFPYLVGIWIFVVFRWAVKRYLKPQRRWWSQYFLFPAVTTIIGMPLLTYGYLSVLPNQSHPSFVDYLLLILPGW